MTLDEHAVLDQVREHGVKFIRLWFTDILGIHKSFTITVEELEGALEDGMGFDGSSIEGFARIDESDMIAMPDPETFRVLPFENGGENVARMFCDILDIDGSPYAGDPRQVLKRNLREADELGYTMYVGPELEFFLFKCDEDGTVLRDAEGRPEVMDKGGYFDFVPLDDASHIRKDIVLALEQQGIHAEYSHHEVAPSQHEIDIRYTDALSMADNVQVLKYTAKEVALNHGCYATFMPKPLFGENGSGMHVHQSLFAGDRNAFFREDDPYHLSATGKHYLAGIMKHAREIALVSNQWVNSYKRLVPGYEAPIYVTWARRNRSDLIRIPQYKPGHEQSTRLELRSPDPAANPYLAFAVQLQAGLEGIRNEYELVPPTEENVYDMSEAERVERGIDVLPGSLLEAVREGEDSSFLRRALGDHVFEKFIENKKIEWRLYSAQVHGWELDRYLPKL